jgi:hypothetical protein
MEPNVLTLVEGMIDGRNEFLSEDFIRRIPFNNRANLISRYMTNETLYLEMINRLYTYNTQTAAISLLSLALPLGNSTFLNPVTIAPTRAQIRSSLEDYPNTTSNCAICQDAISSGGCRIRHCGHVYHRTCIEQWFSSSVRCPVCRYDIREGNHEDQTSSVGGQTSSQ